MRTITEAQWRALEDLSAEGLLSGLPLQTAEKDIHVTELLAALSELEVRHAHFKGLAHGETAIDDGIRLVFAGGTCLAKAYGLTARMSEDIDVKVVLSAPSRELKKSAGHRARLKALHDQIARTINSLNFAIPANLNGTENPRFRDARRYCVIGAAYESKGPSILSLRPELKLEIIHREPRLETPQLQFGYLHERIAQLKPSRSIAMSCMSVGETLAEKVISLLRRCAMAWAPSPKSNMDPALVRHVYDVHQIVRAQPQELAAAVQVFPAIAMLDVEEYRGQFPPFDADPIIVLRSTLEQARTNGVLREQYEQKVLPLIYDREPTAFDIAFAEFESVANQLLATL